MVGLAAAHGYTGNGPDYPGKVDMLGNKVTYSGYITGLQEGDDIVRACDHIYRLHPLHLSKRLGHFPGLTHCRLYENIGFSCHG